MIARFAANKEEQAHRLSKQQSDRWPTEVSKFFKAAESGNWDQATNLYAAFQSKYIFSSGASTNSWDEFMAKRYSSFSRLGLTPTNYWPNPQGPQWRPVDDVYWAIFQFQIWDPELLRFYATNIIASIPSNAVFISGTEEGFFAIPAFHDSLHDGGSFLTLTPNKLADDNYLEYARDACGQKVLIPTSQDLSRAFSVYDDDLNQRARTGQLKPGEVLSTNAGSVVANWTSGVWTINGLLLQQLVTNNPHCEFYYDENWHFDWTTPCLVPHGLILKLNHTPLPALDSADVDHDRAYWREIVRTLTGLEDVDKLSLPQLSNFVQQVYLDGDLSQFRGNPRFATNFVAQYTFAKARISIARIYEWRAWYGTDETERRRMPEEADLAFRQAFALCPRLNDITWYGALLGSQNRTNDLQILAQSVQKFNPDNDTVAYLSSLLNHHP